jgi:hypothetical protein
MFRYEYLLKKIDLLRSAWKNCVFSGNVEMANIWAGKINSLEEVLLNLTIEESMAIV